MTVLSSNLNAVGTVSDLADHPHPLRHLNNLDLCMITHNAIISNAVKCSIEGHYAMHNHAESREGIKKSFRQPDSSSESDNCLSNGKW